MPFLNLFNLGLLVMHSLVSQHILIYFKFFITTIHQSSLKQLIIIFANAVPSQRIKYHDVTLVYNIL